MERCHQIPYRDALMIFCCRPYVIIKIFQHTYFATMFLAVLTHIPQDVSAITKGFNLVKYGESLKKVFCNFKCNLNAMPPYDKVYMDNFTCEEHLTMVIEFRNRQP